MSELTSHPPAITPDDVKGEYDRAIRISRVARLSFFIVAAAFFAWAIPFLPFGLDARDYTSATAVALMLACMSVGLAVLSTWYFMSATRRRDALQAWSAVFDESTGLHNRQYFMERLEAEIGRARGSTRSFHVVLLQARRQDSNGRFVPIGREDLQEFAGAIREVLESNDTLASLRPDELGVLAWGGLHGRGVPVEARLRQALRQFAFAGRRGGNWKVRMGSVSFDGDVDDAAKLLEDTRRELLASAPLVLTERGA
jgi:GGDEF domain-containing protein